MRPLDGLGEISLPKEVELYPEVINPLKRERIHDALDVGVKVINSCLTCGRGQRVGILAGSGVGKSVLLGMMARYTDADVNVISLVGERGKEVREFIEDNLGEEGMKRSVIIVATSDQPPLLRMRCAFVSTAIAEYFRNQEQDVLLAMDSITALRWHSVKSDSRQESLLRPRDIPPPSSLCFLPCWSAPVPTKERGQSQVSTPCLSRVMT